MTYRDLIEHLNELTDEQLDVEIRIIDHLYEDDYPFCLSDFTLFYINDIGE